MKKAEVSITKQIQLSEKCIVEEIVKICKENQLTYYISGGTYLGAVRHKGFIPWDDDMDIAMPRKDYKLFIEIASKELRSPYYLIHFSKDDTYLYHAQVCDKRMKVLRTNSLINKVVDIWVDVFPLDGLPNFFISRKFHEFLLLYNRMMYVYSVFDIYASVNKTNRPFYEKILILIGKTGIPQKLLNPKKE